MSITNQLDSAVNALFACVPRKRPSLERLSQARLIAHRGAHDHKKHIIENTENAFAKALACHCWGIEFDVRATADHVLVVHHDPTLMRLWGYPHAINTMDFKRLRSLVPEIPTLDEIVKRFGKQMHLFIELKIALKPEDGLEQSLRSLIPGKDYHLLSLDEHLFANLRSFPGEALLLVPQIYNVKKFCQLSLKNHYGGVSGHYLLLTSSHIKKLWQAKQQVGVGFVDSKYSLYRELNRGVDWLFTNRVDAVSPYLNHFNNKLLNLV